jgi:hypothetical protein
MYKVYVIYKKKKKKKNDIREKEKGKGLNEMMDLNISFFFSPLDFMLFLNVVVFYQ